METERSVWIVQHDQSSHNTILGVFATGREAEAFAEEVKDHFDNGVLLARFVVGYRFDTNSAGYGTGDETQHPTGNRKRNVQRGGVLQQSVVRQRGSATARKLSV